MGDWMISKKRFWGLALPIWVDEVTGDFEVIGSREELKAASRRGLADSSRDIRRTGRGSTRSRSATRRPAT